jgi:hypothetical protein
MGSRQGIEARQGQDANQLPGSGLVHESPARSRRLRGRPKPNRGFSRFQLKKVDLSIGKLGELVLAPMRRRRRDRPGFKVLIWI